MKRGRVERPANPPFLPLWGTVLVADLRLRCLFSSDALVWMARRGVCGLCLTCRRA